MMKRQIKVLKGGGTLEAVDKNWEFVDNQGHEYMYRVGMSVKEMLERENVEVPFTIELSVISDAKKKLQGNTYYILTSMWYDFNDEISHGRKFVPVKITDVKPGNHIYPLRLLSR